MGGQHEKSGSQHNAGICGIIERICFGGAGIWCGGILVCQPRQLMIEGKQKQKMVSVLESSMPVDRH